MAIAWKTYLNMNVKVTIEKMVFGGQGFGHVNGKACFVWNGLPGEEVEVQLAKNKKDYCEGIAVKIISSSVFRTAPLEAHHLSCSPWQVVAWEKENEWKREMSIEVYKKIGELNIEPEISYLDDYQTGYRNKMEYSFTPLADGTVSLAFFNRGTNGRTGHDGCVLADPAINQTAQQVLLWVNKHKIPYRSLKSVIVRSDNTGNTIAALFIKDKMDFSDYPSLDNKFLGFQIYFSKYNCPASVPTELLYKDGQDFLVAKVRGALLKFGLLSFFQVHIPLFEQALKDIGDHSQKGDEVIDYYCGVGAIALPFKDKIKSAILVDSNGEAIAYARENIELNQAENFTAECLPAEKITNIIEENKVLILDPPRAGLHQDVTDKILEVKPRKVIYMSCNLSTHARDIKALLSGYKISFSRLYNFFPRTPHVEGLVVLDRI